MSNEFNPLFTNQPGLTDNEVEKSRSAHGENVLTPPERTPLWKLYLEKYKDPIIKILLFAAVISLGLAVIENNYIESIGIILAIILATTIGFYFEMDAAKKFNVLTALGEESPVKVRRNGKVVQVARKDIVVGDIVIIEVGDEIPADGTLIESTDLQIDESSLTGEPIITKHADPDKNDKEATYPSSKVLRSTMVMNGRGVYQVTEVGDATEIGKVARSSTEMTSVKTPLNMQLDKLAKMISKFGVGISVAAFVIFLGRDILTDPHNLWHSDNYLGMVKVVLEYFMMAVTLIVMSVPEGMPMAVTLSLALNMRRMLKNNNLVRKLHACETMGAVTVICTDKTGTLTCDQIVLEKYINADGSSDNDKRILRHAFFNSFFQTGLKNLMDKAILSHVKDLDLEHLKDNYKKVDEIPFDFTRRRMSVVVEDKQGKRQIITKGAVEEMLEICSYAEFEGKVQPFMPELKQKAKEISEQMNKQGMRVIAVAQKSYLDKECNFCVKDENEMVLIGYLAFLDPPKQSAASAIRQLHEHGIEVKILSGDNDAVVRTIARQVGIETGNALTGPELAAMSSEEQHKAVRETTVFSKLTPIQKTQIISILQDQQNTVGFLGDGINDASALRQSDIGISVDSAVDIAKESADIILLEKDLMVLEDGVLEGRKTFGNITKYIKMTASSNFGNMFSVMAASAFLPFLPMLPIHLLIQNLLYDISQTTIPFDRMDAEYLRKPRKWDASDLSRFMIFIGPISSVFDIVTYLVMWYVFDCNSLAHQTLFQSGWFIEGLLSQTLIVHMIRTRKIPFIQSCASWQVTGLTFLIMAIGIIIPFTPFGSSIGLGALPLSYFPWLFGILLSYCILTQLVKNWYIRRFVKWL